jgi:hypothetical protein
MLNYSSPFNAPPPVSEQQLQAAMAGMRPKSPYGMYGQNHQDVLDALGGANASSFQRQAQRANDEFSMQERQAARQLALSGLNQMATTERNQQDLATSRLQQMTGTVSSLLGGLYR